MKTNISLVALSLAFAATTAQAQAPIFFQLPQGAQPTDVSVSPAGVVTVVGTMAGGAFSWTPSGGIVVIGPNAVPNSTVRISANGSTIVADQNLSPTAAAIWNGTTWTPIPGLGGSGTGVETTVGAVNPDGTVIVGMGYSVINTAHAFRWNNGSTADLGPFFNSPQSRALGVNGDGSVIVGWEDAAQRQGARWVNGTKTFFQYVDPSSVSHYVQMATAVNTAGTIICGKSIYGISSVAWRWDSGTNAIVTLPNIVGGGGNAIPQDMTDDGSLIVGNDGGTVLFAARQAVIWVNGAAMDPLDYFANLGMAPTGFTELGNITAITNDGGAMCGGGIAGGAGQPEGWVVIRPDFLPNGSAFCFGDGSGTACPCANVGGAGKGCASSSAPLGASLSATGVSSVTPAQDSLTLTATDIAGPGLFFQGSAQAAGGAGNAFGDGLLCVGGAIIRMGVVFPTAGKASYPGGLTPNPIHVAGAPLAAGDVRHYQCWYRDAAAFCTSATFNLTSGLTITWTP